MLKISQSSSVDYTFVFAGCPDSANGIWIMFKNEDIIPHMKIIRLKTIDSTHLYALRLIEQTAFSVNDGVAIVAEEQTNGIGRCKRRWVSEKGNFFTSIIIKTPNDTTVNLGQLSLTVACAVRETILHYISPEISDNLKLHWPNDIYYQKKKISGVLLAISNNLLVVSVGININSSPSIARPSTCLREILQEPYTELHQQDVLGMLLKNIDNWISHICNVSFSDVRSYWLRNINDINCKVTIKNGNSVLNGIFLDIDDSGKAVLEFEGKRVQISSGDLFMNQEEIGYSCD